MFSEVSAGRIVRKELLEPIPMRFILVIFYVLQQFCNLSFASLSPI